ncbi:ComEA family DNA-binding protein [Streptomyces californicus]
MAGAFGGGGGPGAPGPLAAASGPVQEPGAGPAPAESVREPVAAFSPDPVGPEVAGSDAVGPDPVGPEVARDLAAEPGPAADGVDRAAGDSSKLRRLTSVVRERLPLWVRLRCGMAPRTPVALGLVLIAAVALAVFHFWSSGPQTVGVPEPVADEAVVPGPTPDALRAGAPDPVPRPAAGQPPPEGGSGGGDGGQIVVDVSGKVRRPGVRRLPAGSRVADALEAAGGVRAGTDLTGLNRARVLTDGEQVVVGLPPGSSLTGAAGGGASTGGGGQTGTTGGGGPSGPLSLNTATAEQLEALPGVGPVLAQHMIDYRTENNGFRSVDELRQVNGIGDRRFADLQPLVRP